MATPDAGNLGESVRAFTGALNLVLAASFAAARSAVRLALAFDAAAFLCAFVIVFIRLPGDTAEPDVELLVLAVLAFVAAHARPTIPNSTSVDSPRLCFLILFVFPQVLALKTKLCHGHYSATLGDLY